jgi:predicted O-methyltransferase YrrM
MQDTWSRVDEFTEGLLNRPDPVLEAAISASAEAGLPSIAVSPSQGKLLALLVQAMGARRVLEIGTLGGYSTIWMARALAPGGRLLTLELDPAHAAVATANLARAGLSDVATVRVGPASDSLRDLAKGGGAPFDLVFIDADKTGYPEYLELILPLVRKGCLIVADNVVRKGSVADAESTDANDQAIRRYLEMVGTHPRLSGTVLQTVGVKGYDGLALAIVV